MSLLSDGLSKSTLLPEWLEVSAAPFSLSTRTSSWRARPLPISKCFTIQSSRKKSETTLSSAQNPFRIRFKCSTRPLATSGDLKLESKSHWLHDFLCSILDFERNDTCFSIMVTNETIDKIGWSDIRMDRSDPDTLTMVFESRKLPDADIVIKILIPFTVVAIFTTIFFLILMAYRRKWWCFEDVPDKKKAKMAAVVRKRGLNVTNVNNNNNNNSTNNNNNNRGSVSNTSSCSRLLSSSSSPGCTPLSEKPPPYFYDKNGAGN